MTSKLASTFLKNLQSVLVSRVNWPLQSMSFDVASYLDQKIPPEQLITSVRAVVQYKEKIVILENEDRRHFLPGGRMEEGESFDATLEREIAEECGLQVQSKRYLGFLHYKHVTPMPENYGYPYPDMFHLIYQVEGFGELTQMDADGYETSTYLYSAREALELAATEQDRPFLECAMGV